MMKWLVRFSSRWPRSDMYLEVSPYKEILTGLLAALESNEGVVTLTGLEGTGKTSLGYQLSGVLRKQGAQLVFFLHAPDTPGDLRTGILRQLHLRERGEFTARLTEYLQSLAPQNRVLHVLIDNAEQMSELTFDAVLALGDIRDETQTLVRVLLLGSPRLDEQMSRGERSQLATQTAHRFVINPMQTAQLKNFCFAYWRDIDVERVPPEDKWFEELLKLSGGLPGAVLAELGDEEHRDEINLRARLGQVVVAERAAAQRPAKIMSARRSIASASGLSLVMTMAAALVFGYHLVQRTAAPSSAASSQDSTPRPAPVTTAASVAAPAQVSAAPAAAQPVLSGDETANIIAEAEVVRLLNMWVQNWQVQNLPGYFGSYGSGFVPESFDSRAAWETERRRIIAAARDVSIGWRELQIRARSEQTMTVELWLDYRSSAYTDRTLKELTLGFENGRAVILRERNLTVQP